MAAPGDPAGYELAYEAGLRAVEEQADLLRETRDRAGSLMTAAAVAGALAGSLGLGDRAVDIGHVGGVGVIVAIVGFIGVAVTTVMVWWPVGGVFVHDSGVIVGSYVEGDPPLQLPEVHRELALWLGKEAVSNRHLLTVKLRRFNVGLASLLTEIVGLAVVLGDVARG
jgi:hypothetical protein